jgi:hypothetical protein
VLTFFYGGRGAEDSGPANNLNQALCGCYLTGLWLFLNLPQLKEKKTESNLFSPIRAMTNMTILSLMHRLPLECGGAFNMDIHPAPKDIPDSLRPTPLQESMPHDPWISMFPSPTLRDNLILSLGTYDEDDLCGDLVGGLYEGFDDVRNRGLLVWGPPWIPSSWEISEGFARKWGFLLKGCHDVVEATQRYREGRGEDRLVIEV